MNDRRIRSSAPFHPSPIKTDSSHKDDIRPDGLETMMRARIYGVFINLYLACIWCCDHYQLDLALSITVILAGASMLWLTYPTTAKEKCSRIRKYDSNVQHPLQQEQHPLHHHLDQQQQPEDVSSAAVSLTDGTLSAATAISAATMQLSPTATVISIATQDINSNNCIRALGTGIPETIPTETKRGWSYRRLSFLESPLPTDPPPPYYQSKPNSPYPHSPIHPHWSQYSRRTLAVHGLSAGFLLICLGVWLTWSKTESLNELWTLVAGAMLSYSVVVYVALSVFSISSDPGLGSLAGSDLIGPRSNSSTKGEQHSEHKGRILSKECAVELEKMLSKDDKAGFQDMDRIFTETESLSISGPQTVCQEETKGLSLMNRQNLGLQVKTKDIVKIRRHSLRYNVSMKSMTMLQQVKHEIQLWSLLLFVLAPTIPSPIREKFRVPVTNGGLAISDSHQDEQGHDMILRKEATRHDKEIATIEHHRRNGLGNKGGFSNSKALPSGSTLSRLTEATLDPERLGGFLQYYQRKHAAATTRAQNHTEAGRLQKEDITLVVHSSTLRTVRVGLYGASQKRLWTSFGALNVIPSDSLEESAGKKQETHPQSQHQLQS
ncbi:hypothetical protein BG011_001555 [Mortierella polycephala]|uniref:Uncharacterized protein n=1 Tax=Mortierella polycephala TaxID=41804 RepID=A0A9P6Q788_9FUNG|nr:hypothetical protein BG011_001555 [Mortierella polycephala]